MLVHMYWIAGETTVSQDGPHDQLGEDHTEAAIFETEAEARDWIKQRGGFDIGRVVTADNGQHCWVRCHEDPEYMIGQTLGAFHDAREMATGWGGWRPSTLTIVTDCRATA